MSQYTIVLLISLTVFFLSFIGTRFLISWSHRFGLIDFPNERSSHIRPTPRGGGLAFIAAFLIGCGLLYLMNIVGRDWLLPVISAGPLIAVIGWMDDRRSMSATSRLLTHFSASLLVYVLITRGFSVNFNVSFVPADWPILTFIFCLFFVAWMVNLYNFMDGIDGLAGANGVVCGICLAAIAAWQNQIELAALYALLAFAVGGFLVFNWSPAKIFMGDSGSTFLGFAFAVVALTGKGMSNVGFVANVIVMGCFIVDATYTLCVRAARGKRIYQAHRDHAFQHAVQMGWSHRGTVFLYSAITVFWLVPMALGALMYDRLSLLFLAIAYVPLVGMQIYFKAGLEERAVNLRHQTAHLMPTARIGRDGSEMESERSTIH